MIIHLSELSADERRFEGTEPDDVMGLSEGDPVRVEGPIRYDLSVERVSGEMIVRGSIAAHVVFNCARCTRRSSLEVEDRAFARAYDLQEGPVPWAEKGESVDLTPDIREATILNLPAYPVCKPDCLGLCPRCGADLNAGKCDCKPVQGFRWGELDKLKM